MQKCSSVDDINYWLNIAQNIETEIGRFREVSHLLNSDIANTYFKRGRCHQIVHPAIVCVNKINRASSGVTVGVSATAAAHEFIRIFTPHITDSFILKLIESKLN